jgi:plasmid maintenance system antidote protein VapI
METVNDRLREFLNEKSISQISFSRSIGSTQQYVSAILNNKRNIGTKLFNKIIETYPSINDYWLLTGKNNSYNKIEEEEEYINLQDRGDVFLNESTLADRFQELLDFLGLNVKRFTNELGEERADKYYAIVKGKTKKFNPDSISRIKKSFPEINTIWLNTGKGEMTSDTKIPNKDWTAKKIAIEPPEELVNEINLLRQEVDFLKEESKINEEIHSEFKVMKELMGSILKRGILNEKNIKSLKKKLDKSNSKEKGREI